MQKLHDSKATAGPEAFLYKLEKKALPPQGPVLLLEKGYILLILLQQDFLLSTSRKCIYTILHYLECQELNPMAPNILASSHIWLLDT